MQPAQRGADARLFADYTQPESSDGKWCVVVGLSDQLTIKAVTGRVRKASLPESDRCLRCRGLFRLRRAVS